MGDVIRLQRVAVVGAGGTVGRELLAVLERTRFPVLELVPIGSDVSMGEGVDFQGEDLALRPPGEGLGAVDAVFVCCPADAALDWTREALRARIPCFDLSGALADSADVPLLAADGEVTEADLASPVISVAGGPALAWHRVLAPLHAESGIRRVVATAVESLSATGARALEALSNETIALLNQQEAPEAETLAWPVAFDCHPATDAVDREGHSGREARIRSDLGRLLDPEIRLDLTVLRIPTFTGEGASLALETERPLAPGDAAALLAKVPGLEVAEQDLDGLRTRATTGRDEVLVGRMRSASDGAGLLLWLAADTQRLTAENAVALARAKLLGR